MSLMFAKYLAKMQLNSVYGIMASSPDSPSIQEKIANLERRKKKMKVIFVKYFEDDRTKLEFNPKGNWVDLYTACEVYMKKGDYFQIPLGVAMQLPPHHEAIIAPRSSTFKRWGILQANSIGIVDSSYCGDHDEWKFPALATKDIYIPKGTRIAQFRVFASQDAFEEIRLVEVQELNNKDRGGFGTTG